MYIQYVCAEGGHRVVQPRKEGNRASAFADSQGKGFNASKGLGFRGLRVKPGFRG